MIVYQKNQYKLNTIMSDFKYNNHVSLELKYNNYYLGMRNVLQKSSFLSYQQLFYCSKEQRSARTALYSTCIE